MSFFSHIRHYISLAREAYQNEKEIKAQKNNQGKRKDEELAFMPAALEITETPASPAGRAVLITICLFFCIAVVWGLIGTMDIIAVAQGRVITVDPIKVIQPLETGVIRAIHVQEGMSVQENDVLIELDHTTESADQKRLTQQFLSTQVEIAHLKALLEPDPLSAYKPPENAPETLKNLHRSYLTSERQSWESKQASLDGDILQREAEIVTLTADISRITRKMKWLTEKIEGKRILFTKGVLAKQALSEEEYTLDETAGHLDVAHKRLAETQAALKSAQANQATSTANFQRDIHMRLTETQQRAAIIEQELIKAEERIDQKTLRSPVNGVIHQLNIHTPGGVVTAAQTLVRIIPENAKLEVEAMILNKDIGFVHKDQHATLKIESFPFTRYGTINGRVRHLYKDAVESNTTGLVYPARVTMDRSNMDINNRTINLTPGMNVTVEIKTGQRRLIDYLLSPLQRYRHESLREN